MPQFTEMRPPESWSSHDDHGQTRLVVVGYAGAGGRVVTRAPCDVLVVR